MTTKVHAVTDGLGNPLRFLLSSRNRNDICMAQTLLEPFELKGKLILADKGYDSDKFVRWLEDRGGIVVIPSRIIAKRPRKTDWHTQRTPSGGKSVPQTEKLLPFRHQIRKENSLFPCSCLPRLYPRLVALMVLKQTLACYMIFIITYLRKRSKYRVMSDSMATSSALMRDAAGRIRRKILEFLIGVRKYPAPSIRGRRVSHHHLLRIFPYICRFSVSYLCTTRITVSSTMKSASACW